MSKYQTVIEKSSLSGIADDPVWAWWGSTALNTPAKAPRRARLDKIVNAKPNDPSTWATMARAEAAAREHRGQGIGVMMGPLPDDPGLHLVAFDFDNLRDAKVVSEIADTIDSFTEISVSGKGVHILALTRDPPQSRDFHGDGCKIQFFSHDRFIALTFDETEDDLIGGFRPLRVVPQATMDKALDIAAKWSKPKESGERTRDDTSSGAAYRQAMYLILEGRPIEDFEEWAIENPWADYEKNADRAVARTWERAETAAGKIALQERSGADFEDLTKTEPIPGDSEPKATGRFEIILASEVEPKAVNWIWDTRLARGKGTLISGRPSRGKSTISIGAASTISRGGRWPDGTRAKRGNVLILSSEDAPDDTMVPRIMAADGDRTKIGFLKIRKGGSRKERMFNLKDDLAELAGMIRTWGNVELVIIDPITAYMGEKTDSHKAADVRAVLNGVAEWAQELDIAVLAITHPSKAFSSAMNAATGSQAYVAFFRIVYLADELPDDPKRMALASIKYNLGPKPPTISYTLVNEEIGGGIGGQPVIEWGDAIDVTADQVVRGINDAARPVSKVDLAQDFLNGFFSFIEPGEWIPVEQIEDAAKKQNLAWRTIETAKKALGIEAKKRGKKWGWALRPS